MSNRIKEIATGLRKLNEVEGEMEIERAATFWTNQLARHEDEYLHALQILTDAIMFASQINQSTPYEFPLSLTELHSEEFYKIITINTVYSNGRIVISVEIPLLDKTPFNLYHLHPCPSFLPISHNVSTAMVVVPQTPFLAINRIHQEYFLPTENFMQGCKTHPDKYVCQLTLSLYNLEEAPICETNILTQTQTIEWKKCNVRSLKSTRTITNHLSTPNMWLYSVRETTPVKIKCNHRAAGYELILGSGILRLKKNCQAQIDNLRLIASETTTLRMNSTFKPLLTLNITQLIPQITPHHVKIISDYQLHNIPIGMLHDKANEKSIALTEIECQAQDLATHHCTQRLTTHMIYGGATVGVLIFVIGILWITKRNCKHIC
ncbi:uncharacterized protein LOC128882368 [Hylaeus volcanicus]|uniref:uncharacterized protein LOC128882368 n=1 Tax=Hylaeus volcanicus TaxID=313075 RepID=UPI0023B82B44|nr:uncharacterized protein LOC128882368 [Hylaeus volcanicus]